MALITHFNLTCDHCGRSQELALSRSDYDPTCPPGLRMAANLANARGGVWHVRRATDEHLLCGECAARYDGIVALHQREIEEFLHLAKKA